LVIFKIFLLFLPQQPFKTNNMFNKETEYALRGLVYIKLQNLKDRRPGTAEVAKEIGAPHFFIAKILQRLVKAGFLESLKGKGGGFFFDATKPEVPLARIIAATEGDNTYSGCGFGLKQCSEDNPCPLHDKYAPIRDSINTLVTNETIQSLAEKVYLKEINQVV
jgi:Rrf2 family protein